MLELREITKDYVTGGEVVHALKGVDLAFRESEFVAILGPSGCGKTTMLNIIGGLDQYTSGDLVINGRSTTQYDDRDWDAYRNHRVGFVFQSYNLIPHQSVLQNVELALTLSGVSKKERRERAIKALEQVGLGNQLRKRPSQMSGGQMQRVAIARAIVNNPDIILADEPTGALDTETSVQVMDILKEISKDHLVIMVTHNPDLAEKYATRIVRMLDGVLLDDSKPLTIGEARTEIEKAHTKEQENRKKKMPGMKFSTSFGLSLKNLITKGGRTALTSFAGSIGIIGIALIFAVSHGMTTYINFVQEETLSSYPLSLESQNIELSSVIETFMGLAESEGEHENDKVYQAAMLENLVNALSNLEATENDLAAFKTHLEKRIAEDEGFAQAVNGVQYGYSLSPIIYTESVDGEILHSDMNELMSDIMGMSSMRSENVMNSMEGSSPFYSMMSDSSATYSSGLWQEMLPGKDGEPINDLLFDQYDLVYGEWPTKYNQVVLVLDENNELQDLSLYSLGLLSKEKVEAILEATRNKTEVSNEKQSWTYQEITDRTYRVILPASCYVWDEAQGIYTDLRDTDAGMRYLYTNGIDLEVSGIIKPNADALTGMLNGAIGYTHLLTEYIIQQATDADAVKAQIKDFTTDIFTGLPFRENTENMRDVEKEKAFRAYAALWNNTEKSAAFVKISSIMPEESLKATVDQTMAGFTRETMEKQLLSALSQEMGLDLETVQKYLDSMSDEEMSRIVREAVEEQVRSQYASSVENRMQKMTTKELSGAFNAALPTYTTEQCALYYDNVIEFSKTTYEDNLTKLGYLDLEVPSFINIYASSFADKDIIEEDIKTYNDSVDEMHAISYTDYVGLMMSSITTIINAITYVLIGFVAISLVVSSIMIGVITLISVQERTKEIGILRAIGASKRNVSGMFNAETVIIGFTSGVLGVAITYLLCIPLNALLHKLTDIQNLSAILPWPVGVALVAISMLLTLLAGIIPSRSASKKDPVIALRTE